MTVLPAVRAVGPCVRVRRLCAVCFSGVCTVCLMVCVCLGCSSAVCGVCVHQRAAVACVPCVQWACRPVSLGVRAVSGRVGGPGSTRKVLSTQNPCCRGRREGEGRQGRGAGGGRRAWCGHGRGGGRGTGRGRREAGRGGPGCRSQRDAPRPPHMSRSTVAPPPRPLPPTTRAARGPRFPGSSIAA